MAYEIGSITEGTVVEIAKFGAFVKMAGGKTGLVHISEISDKYVQEVSDYVTVGASVLVKIISIDEKKRIQLSIKAVGKEDEEKFARSNAEKAAERKLPPTRPPAQRDAPPPYQHSEPPRFSQPQQPQQPRHHFIEEDSFERKLKSFMRQSEDRQVDVKRSLESKRGDKKKKR
jgi:S1 RNA binding domain protein